VKAERGQDGRRFGLSLALAEKGAGRDDEAERRGLHIGKGKKGGGGGGIGGDEPE